MHFYKFLGLFVFLMLVPRGGHLFLWQFSSLSSDTSHRKIPKPRFILQPRMASFDVIVGNNRKETELFQLAENQRIYVIDYENLHAQAQALNRIALFLEWQEAPKDRVLNDEEVKHIIQRTVGNPSTLFFGHDYRAADLAGFFNAARDSNISLNLPERSLRNTLIALNFMENRRGKLIIVFPEKALITITEEQKDDPKTKEDETITTAMRGLILMHELSHGEFFTHSIYADDCKDFWSNRLTVNQRTAFTRFLVTSQHYDGQREELLINEFQAYLAYSGIDGVFFGYDVVTGIDETEMKQLRKQFVVNSPALFKPNWE